MSVVDYAEMYSGYWSRPDRWGGHSFKDPGPLCEMILAVCRRGPILDIGCGMGLLVRELIARGVDAYAIDVAANVIDEGNRRAPGRYRLGSVLDIPYEEASFPSIMSVDMLEHLAPEDVPRAISEMFRVVERDAFIRLDTLPDIDKRWHLTMQRRQWWDDRFLGIGFRKHPLYLMVTPYEALENDGAREIDFALEKIPAEALARYPLADLKAERDLHMDMLREGGRRSDAHVLRYTLARDLVRPGDVVVDAACGLGYGSAILAAGTGASRVIGVDNSAYAIEYARLNYSTSYSACEYRCGDVMALDGVADVSVDVVASFETLEHLDDPEGLLGELDRVLKPGGRVMFSVPNDWTDDGGRDPNPFHLQVYTWEKLIGQLRSRFRVTRAFAQIAGGAMKLTDRPRTLREVAVDATPDCEAEWWLVCVEKPSQ